MKVEQNISRLKHLLSLYKMSVDDLIVTINEGLKKRIQEEDILANQIHVSHLKRIDKVFHKGLHYYLDPTSPEISKDESIFFRKQSFETELNIGAKNIVHQYEEFKISLSAIAKLAGVDLKRLIPTFTITDPPDEVASEIRSNYYPTFNQDLKAFLKSLIFGFAERNILVFEFVETWNKKEKANIDGVFLQPNVIVLKRQQESFRREIFTLIHEFGHYLLSEEEVESLSLERLADVNMSRIERWCNDFAYYYLIGEYDDLIEGIRYADARNDYCHDMIADISKKTHLSKIALFTRLLYRSKISVESYELVRADFAERYRVKIEEERRKREIEKELGVEHRGSAPKPIQSPLLVTTIQAAFYEGVINEYDVCRTLKIKPEQIDSYLQ